jgi:hypothetical protein
VVQYSENGYSLVEHDALMATLLLTFRLILLSSVQSTISVHVSEGITAAAENSSDIPKIKQSFTKLRQKIFGYLQTDTSSTETSVTNYQATLLKIRKTVSFTINAVKNLKFHN